MQFAESYYSSTGTDLRTEDLENLLNESDKMDKTFEETLSELSNTSDAVEKYVPPVSPVFPLDSSNLVEGNIEKRNDTTEDNLSN